jgi:hypothetical protein
MTEAPSAPPEFGSATGRAVLLESIVAGTWYYQAVSVMASLKPGTAIVLSREPDNPHDPLAVAVLTRQGAKLGYVPRACNLGVALRLDQGVALEARVVSSDYVSWPRICIRITCAALDAVPLPQELAVQADENARSVARERAQKERRITLERDLATHSLAEAEYRARREPARAMDQISNAVDYALSAWLRAHTEAPVSPVFGANAAEFISTAPADLSQRFLRWMGLWRAVVSRLFPPPGTDSDDPRDRWGSGSSTADPEVPADAPDAASDDPTASPSAELVDGLLGAVRQRDLGEVVRFLVWEGSALIQAMQPQEAHPGAAASWTAERRARWLWGFTRLAMVIDRLDRGDRVAVTALRVLGNFDDLPGVVATLVRDAIGRERRLLPRGDAEIEKARRYEREYPDIFGVCADPLRRVALVDEAGELADAWPARRAEIPDLVARLRQLQPRARRRGRLRRRVAPDGALHRIERLLDVLAREHPGLYQLARAIAVAERPMRRYDRLLPHALRGMAQALSRASFGMDWRALCAHLPAPVLKHAGPSCWVRGIDLPPAEAEDPCRAAATRGIFVTPPATAWEQILADRTRLMLGSLMFRGRAARNFAMNLALADFAFLRDTVATSADSARAPPAGCSALIEWWYWRARRVTRRADA